MATLLAPAGTDGTEPLRRTFGLVRTTLVASGPIVPPDEGNEDVSAVCGRGPFVFAQHRPWGAPACWRSRWRCGIPRSRRGSVTPVADLDYVTELRAHRRPAHDGRHHGKGGPHQRVLPARH